MGKPKQWLQWLHSTPIDRNAPPEDGAILTEPCRNHSEADEAYLASLYRKELIARYGEAGRKIHFAEAFGVSEYGTQLIGESVKELFPF